MRDKKKYFELLDCTLRDGGYYNNWNFSKIEIQKYLNAIATTGIKFVELGFRFFESKEIKGLTAYTSKNLLKTLSVPKGLNIGIMINASDLIHNNQPKKEIIKKLVNKKNIHKIKFIRIACHHHEVFLLKDCFQYLKKMKLKIFLNIMQISELNFILFKKILDFLNKNKIKTIYLADSLGCLKTGQLKKIITFLKRNWKGEIGLHAHDNLKLAFSNSKIAIKKDFEWIDSTITGMGRGPGNTKTEDILNYNDNYQITKKFLATKSFFENLKKFYKWGSNKYYVLAAKNKIHPTYIQKILLDERYKKKDYLQIINQLKKNDTKKFNPYKLINSTFFLSTKPSGRSQPKKILDNKNFLILGPGKNLSIYKKKIQKFIKKVNPFVICLNTVKVLNENNVHLRVACHPMRILSDIKFHNSQKTKLAIPYSMMLKNIRRLVKINRSQIVDYGLSIKYKSNVKVMSNYCIMENPLAIGYCLSMLVSGKIKSNQIFLAGFDGYEVQSSDMDETEQLINTFKNNFFKRKLRSLTPTKYTTLDFLKKF